MQFNTFKNSILIHFWCSFLRSEFVFKLGDYLSLFTKEFLTTISKNQRWYVRESRKMDRFFSAHLQVLRKKLLTSCLFWCCFRRRASPKKPKNIYLRFALLNGKVSVQMTGMMMPWMHVLFFKNVFTRAYANSPN